MGTKKWLIGIFLSSTILLYAAGLSIVPAFIFGVMAGALFELLDRLLRVYARAKTHYNPFTMYNVHTAIWMLVLIAIGAIGNVLFLRQNAGLIELAGFLIALAPFIILLFKWAPKI